VAVVLIKERHIVEAFELAGSTSAERAIVPGDIGVHEVGIGWRRLRSRAIVRETHPDSGRFYLDVEVWQSVRAMRRRLVMVMIVLLALAAAFGVFGTTIAWPGRR
jgi:hypothetical protein